MKTGCWVWLMCLALLIVAVVLAGAVYATGLAAVQGLSPLF